MELDVTVKQNLAAALYKCPVLRDPEYRKQVAADLEDGYVGPIPNSSKPILYVRNILETSLQYPLGLQSLLDVVRSYAASASSLKAAHYVLDTSSEILLRQHVSWSEMTELRYLLRSEPISDPEALAAFRAAAGPLAPLDDDLLENRVFLQCMDWLARTTDERGVELLLRYLARSRAKLAEPTRQALYAWMEKAAKGRVDVKALWEAPIPDGQGDAPFEAAILIKVTLPSSSDDFQLDAWLYSQPEQRIPLHLEPPEGDEETYHKHADLPALIRKIVGKCQRDHLNSSAEVRVELVVPMRLLISDADCLETLILDKPVKLGKHYRLVVRSWERLYGDESDDLVPQWRACWEKLPPTPVENDLVCASQQEEYSETFYDKLRTPGRMFLGAAPPGDDEKSLASMVEMMLIAGTGVALWVRKRPLDPGEAHGELYGAVFGKPSKQLPRRVQSLRTGACPIWENVTLLWDDPHYCPGDLPYLTSVK